MGVWLGWVGGGVGGGVGGVVGVVCGVWCGVVWRGMWCGVVWSQCETRQGVVWCGVVWCGVVWWWSVAYTHLRAHGSGEDVVCGGWRGERVALSLVSVAWGRGVVWCLLALFVLVLAWVLLLTVSLCLCALCSLSCTV